MFSTRRHTSCVFILAALAVMLALATLHSPICAQGYVPANASVFNKDGTVAGVLPGMLQMITKHKAKWLVQVIPGRTEIKVSGTASPDYLHAGAFVRFTADIDDAGTLVGEIKTLEITTPFGKNPTGMFPMGAEFNAKPVSKVVAGAYEFRGKVVSYQDGEIQVVAGKKVWGKVASDAKITVNVQDISLAKPDDKLNVVGYYYEKFKSSKAKPGQAVAQKVKITMLAPLTAPPQKGPVKPTKIAPKAGPPVAAKLPQEPKTEKENPPRTAKAKPEETPANEPPAADPNDVFGFEK